MKTIEIKKTGNPEVLEIKDVKLDEPKSEEVLICLLYTSPSPRD